MTSILPNSIFAPPPEMTISQWADEYREIPPEAASEPGHWSTSRAPYQKAMMDAVSDSRFDRVIMMTAAQVGKTEMLLNIIGYYIHQDPAPMLLLQPTIQMGEAFSKDRLATMLRDCSCLHGRVKDPRSRDSGNTLLHKTFPGGHITIAGANSPASLASRPIRILMCDEVDRYPPSAGTEGDPVSLAVKRTQNFWNRRIILVSTPTLKESSRIYKEFLDSTQAEWEVPCPHCGSLNAFDWERLIFKDRTSPVMRCESCGHESSESEWKSMQSRGQWQAKSFSRNKGFHVNALASPWVSWPEIVSDYWKHYRGGPEMMKVWRNTVLGLPYEESFGLLEVDEVMTRCEKYESEIPEGVLLLTCGVDTQDNRLEYEILGHGLNGETWGIKYGILYGDPGGQKVWDDLDRELLREWTCHDGYTMGISCTCIDSGGHRTDDVYDFCRKRRARNVYPIVGRGRFGMSAVNRPKMHKRGTVYLFTLGVNTLKGELFTKMQAHRGEFGYCHFPDESDESRGYDRMYFAGLLSEKMVIKRTAGQESVTWELRDRNIRNEPLDCRVYAMGAFKILNPDMTRHAKERGVSGGGHEVKRVRSVKRRVFLRGMRL